MHLSGWLPPHLNDEGVSYYLEAHGIEVPSLSVFRVGPKERPPGLLLGHTAFPTDEIRPGVQRWVTALAGVDEG
jgi:DNA-binding transcriptional MocR family regulator